MKRGLNKLITEGLGYCCEWFFFQHFQNSDLIAARLGCSVRAVQVHKAAEKRCEECPNCMRKR